MNRRVRKKQGALDMSLDSLLGKLDQPFGGLIQISSEPMLNALSHLAKGGS